MSPRYAPTPTGLRAGSLTSRDWKSSIRSGEGTADFRARLVRATGTLCSSLLRQLAGGAAADGVALDEFVGDDTCEDHRADDGKLDVAVVGHQRDHVAQH